MLCLFPPDNAGKEDIIAALVTNVEAMIKADRKITALKELQVIINKLAKLWPLLNLNLKDFAMQGHMWRTGYKNNELKGIVFDDVPEALEKWHALGIKVAISFS